MALEYITFEDFVILEDCAFVVLLEIPEELVFSILIGISTSIASSLIVSLRLASLIDDFILNYL